MSKAENPLGKILSGTSDKNNTLAGAISDRAQAGFVLDGGKGSHRLDRHPDDRKMVTPLHGKDIKPVSVRQSRNLLKHQNQIPHENLLERRRRRLARRTLPTFSRDFSHFCPALARILLQV